jgi:hypothetical protein
MSIELILGGIGTVLGIANFVYWAWWSKRDKVGVVYPYVSAEFLSKGHLVNFPLFGNIRLKRDVILIDAGCELFLKNGVQGLEIKDVEVRLDKKTCEKLSRYFEARRHSRFDLWQIDYYDRVKATQPWILSPKKTIRFQGKIPIDCTDEYEKKHGKLKGSSIQEFIQPFLDRLETEYQICWTRYDGKRLCWIFPDKWWRNLGKKLWG